MYNARCSEAEKMCIRDSDGTLTISGNGEMQHADGNSVYAWGGENTRVNRNDIKKVVVQEGVTSLAEYICWDFADVYKRQSMDCQPTMNTSSGQRKR